MAGKEKQGMARLERKLRGAREVDFPVTVVDTRWKRIKRAAVG